MEVMIVCKRYKGNVLEMYKTIRNPREIESYTFLNLTVNEAKELLNAQDDWKIIEDAEKFSCSPTHKCATTKYVSKSKLDKTWKSLCGKHSKINPAGFVSVKDKFISDVDGTSMLIRDPKNKVIKIALRKDNNSAFNKICIDNFHRTQFFNDCLRGNYYYKNSKWAIDYTDDTLYAYWDNFMTREFFSQLNKSKK